MFRISLHQYILQKEVKLATLVEGDLKAPFSIATTPRCRGSATSFPGLVHFTLDPYLIHIYQPSARSLTGLNSEFPSPRLVASPRLKNLVCPTIYP